MSLSFSYRHLYYFWVVGQEGGMARAAQRLGMAVQTVSAQVRELERDLGTSLLKPAGRGLVLTEAGQAAMARADQIFQLGEQLPAVVREAGTAPVMRLVVGISDRLPKLAVHHLLQPVMGEVDLRLICHEGEFDDLLGELALRRIDILLSDREAPARAHLKLNCQCLASSPLAWYAPPQWAGLARADFPLGLNQVPVLLPTSHAAVRAPLDHWLDQHNLRPRIAGEFEDSALLATFAAAGMGVMPAASLLEDELIQRFGLQRVGECEGLAEPFHAITVASKWPHPLAQRLLTQHANATAAEDTASQASQQPEST
jgi:LysR family transcriptional activator of nhaA